MYSAMLGIVQCLGPVTYCTALSQVSAQAHMNPMSYSKWQRLRHAGAGVDHGLYWLKTIVLRAFLLISKWHIIRVKIRRGASMETGTRMERSITRCIWKGLLCRVDVYVDSAY